MPKALFISQDASRTGAPILLLNVLELLKKNKSYKIDILLKYGGEINESFSTLFPTRQYYVTSKKPLFERAVEKAKRIVNRKDWRPYTANEYDFILNNTITNGDILSYYQRSPIITYVHELENFINTSLNKQHLEVVLNRTLLFLYPSAAVKNMLLSTFGIDSEKVAYLPYHIKDYLPKKEQIRESIRKELDLENQIVVGGMGITGWRKGSDFFLLLANRLKNNARFKFLWVGSDVFGGNIVFKQLQFDKARLNLDNLILIPSVPDSWRYLAAMDLFFLSSREDPYPLVVLEAAMMELPIVCFEGTGGANEFVSDDAGVLLPYLDLDYAANFLEEYYANQEKYQQMVKQARKKYELLHSEKNVLAYFEKAVSTLDNLKRVG